MHSSIKSVLIVGGVAGGASCASRLRRMCDPIRPWRRRAGLELGPRGGIQVDARVRTSDPNLYAGGVMMAAVCWEP